MSTAGTELAGVTRAAVETTAGGLAKQHAGQRQRQLVDACVRHAHEQQGMGQPPLGQLFIESLPRIALPG